MIVAGFGFSERATDTSLEEAFAALQQRPDLLVTLRHKAVSPVFQAFARRCTLPVDSLEDDQIAGIVTATQSPRIQARFNTGSVAEAAALVGAGAGARLIQTRYVTTDGLATVALAEMIDR